MQDYAKNIRKLTLKCIASKGSGHIGGSLSIVDVLTVLYHKHMRYDVNNPKKDDRDRLVVSKGHAGPAVYATLASVGFFPEEMLYTLNKFGTNLPSHCDMNKTPGVDMTTGSLGQGLSCAVGISLGAKLKGQDTYTYCIIGDGESQEGQVYEAMMYASQKKLDNLIVFLDNNHMQIDDTTDNINSLGDFYNKSISFGFDTYSIDGHNLDEIDQTIAKAKTVKNKPHMIILNTIKGKGVSFMENQVGWHGVAPNDEQYRQAMAELDSQYVK